MLAYNVALTLRKAVEDIPISVRYFKEEFSINLRQSVYYGLQTLWNLLIFHLHSLKLMHSPIFKKNNQQEPVS